MYKPFCFFFFFSFCRLLHYSCIQSCAVATVANFAAAF